MRGGGAGHGGRAGAGAAARGETTRSQDGEQSVSISGVIGASGGGPANDGDDDGDDDEGRVSARERAEMLHVVVQDAGQVDGVVADIAADLQGVEAEFAQVRARAAAASAAHDATRRRWARSTMWAGARATTRRPEADFAGRCAGEHEAAAGLLAQMDAIRAFYDGYANAYDTLILEAGAAAPSTAGIAALWAKAADAAARLAQADRRERHTFRHEVGEFLPTDLWVGMADPPPPLGGGAGRPTAADGRPAPPRAGS